MIAPEQPVAGVELTVRGLRKSYAGQEVLKGLDFDVRAGELFVIMGPSGSGKTVLLRHLIGLEQPSAGEILIDGLPADSAELMANHRMAMVFQSGGLLNSLTVGENVGLYLSEHRLKPPEEITRIVSEKLAVVGLVGTEYKMPADLSGGMKKRVAIARALVCEPQLIFYDEPTSELDPVSASLVTDEIVKLNDRMQVTSVVVSHDRELAFGIADRLAVVMDGRMLAVGTPEEIRRTHDPEIRGFLSAAVRRHALQPEPARAVFQNDR